MKVDLKDKGMGFYCEIDGLFVEWELDRTYIDIINVQLTHPDDPQDDSRWIDITDHMTESSRDQLREQVNEFLIDQAQYLEDYDSMKGDYLYDLKKGDSA